MRIVFKSEEFAGLNFTREYTDGFAVDEHAQIREEKSDLDYNGIHAHHHRIYCPGMVISMVTGALDRDLVNILESDFPYLQMHFELTTTGCLYEPQARFEIATEIYTGFHALLFYPALKGRLSYLKKPESYSVEIELTIDFLRRIFNNDLEILREFGENIEKGHPAIMGNRSFPITATMKHILSQIRECTYSGVLKRIFIEAKVTELLTMQISQIQAMVPGKKVLKKNEIDKLHQVKDLLLQNIHNPYSIEALSKIAGINRTKLQEGFKDQFGTTIFGFIIDQRLEEARIKIQDSSNEKSIAEIATMSGYKNPQHFTTAFKRKYGFLPKELRR